MSVPRTVADVLEDHVTLEVDGIDRMHLNVYVPQLQWDRGVVRFLRFHRGHQFPSSAMMTHITRAFVESIEQFVTSNAIPLIRFTKNQRKDDVALEHLAKFSHTEGVLLVGKSQEKTPVFRTEKRRNLETGSTYPWIVKSTAMVNHYYFYRVDEDFGPFFLKFCSHFPYAAKLCLNEHENLKRQLDKAGIPYEALDNGILSCDDPARAQKICDGLSAAKINACFANGWPSCRTLLPPKIVVPAIATTSPSCKPNSLSLRFSTAPSRVASSSKKSSARISTSVGPIAFSSSSIAE